MVSTSDLKEEAARLGFDLCGVALPGPSDYDLKFHRWLERGYHADMSYLSRPDAVAKRADIRLVLQGVRAVVVVGTSYATHCTPAPSPTRAVVARYAWGQDYHRAVLERLNKLASWVEGAAAHPVSHRAYVDTGPVLEREWGRRAGLGWIGKNSCLIHPRTGSYFFLGVLLLDLELEPDAPFANDFCGTCQACIRACPAGALVAPHTLDARKCISYLTIENRGGIPPELRASIGARVFGCDVCQEVCPWNKRASANAPAALEATHGGPRESDPADLLRLDDEGFQRLFAGSAMRRARRPGIARNAAVVLGNVGTTEDREVLVQAVQDADVIVAEHAAWALRRLSQRTSLH